MGEHKRNNGGSPKMPQLMNLERNRLTSLHCPDCMSQNFTQVVWLWEVPGILSPTGMAQVVTEGIWKCDRCGAVRGQWELTKLLPQQREILSEAAQAQPTGDNVNA
jgi:hypothetical protein